MIYMIYDIYDIYDIYPVMFDLPNDKKCSVRHLLNLDLGLRGDDPFEAHVTVHPNALGYRNAINHGKSWNGLMDYS